ncbi:BCCT family transporter [Antarctobacter jejuensis]|uniref:BCCT family transporter n=1 Tax=Antarctobacter jejuensis TaxID=1439938 RepID=UPI003FD1BC4D
MAISEPRISPSSWQSIPTGVTKSEKRASRDSAVQIPKRALCDVVHRLAPQVSQDCPEHSAFGSLGKMVVIEANRPLRIRTVRTGIYKGFSPAVAMTAKSLVLFMVILLLFLPDTCAIVLETLTKFTLSRFAGWYVYLTAAFVLFIFVIACLPVSGRVRLGPDGERPSIGTTGWLAMMFCSGVGTGILVFSVSEPLSHFANNPEILSGEIAPGSRAAMISALRYVFLHWGLSAWCGYALTGLALGLACHRFGHPLTMRSVVSPLLGRKLEGPLGHVIDILAILAILTGIATTIVFALEQICTGLAELTGNPFFADALGNPTFAALLMTLVLAVAMTIASITSGLDRGVKWVSQIGILMAFVVMLIFAFFGVGTDAFGIFAQTSLGYVSALPAQVVTLYDPAASTVQAQQRIWQEGWTVFYWSWWIAFAPFVGLFLARVSRGRTVREFILGSVLCPTVMCFVWFSVTGGSAVSLELDGTAAGRLLTAEHAFRIYKTIDLIMPQVLAVPTKGALVLLFLILCVASSTAAIIAIKSIGAAGSALGETRLHSTLWAVVIAAVTGAVIAVGGLASCRNLMIMGALPFSMIMALMIPSVLMMLRTGEQAATAAPGRMPVDGSGPTLSRLAELFARFAKNRHGMNRSGLVLLVLASTLWATTGIAAGLVPNEIRWPPEMLAFARLIVAGPVLMCLSLLAKGLRGSGLSSLRLPVLFAFALACVIFQVALFTSFERLGVVTTVFLGVTLRPFLCMAWNQVTSRERVGRNTILALAIAILGVTMLSFDGFESPSEKPWATGLPVVMICAVAFVVMTFTTRSLTERAPALAVTGAGLTLSAVLLGGFILLATAFGGTSLDGIELTTPTLVLTGYLALFPTAAAFFCFSHGMARCDGAAAGLVAGMTQPAVAVVLAVALLGEQMTLIQLAGCVTLTGTILLLWQKDRPCRRVAPVPDVRPGLPLLLKEQV